MIPGLDGLRAIAFLMVLGYHTGEMEFGWAGVQLFFVLSGFLLTGILLQMKDTLPVKQYFYKFYGRRFLRIFPLYFFYLFLLTLAIQKQDAISWTLLRDELLKNVQPQLSYAYFYLYDFVHASVLFKNSRFLVHLWSLSIEEQFYVFWPLILFFTSKAKLKKLFFTIIAVGPLLRLGTYLIYSYHLLPNLPANAPLAVYVLPFSHVDAFAFGAYISTFGLPQPRKQLLILASATPLLGFLTQYFSTGTIQLTSFGYEFPMFTAYKFVWGFSLLNYCFAMIIYSVYQTKLFTSVLDHFILRYLGKISYGLYVYHLPVIWFLLAFQLKHKFLVPFYLGQARTYFLVLLITVIIASVSFYFFEKPINDLKDRFFPLRSGDTKAKSTAKQPSPTTSDA
jgi:peptidoglycan/LPS O-acetylase OafA/YrhL